MKETIGDSCLYFKMDSNGELCGIIGLSVNYCIGSSDNGLEEFIKQR